MLPEQLIKEFNEEADSRLAVFGVGVPLGKSALLADVASRFSPPALHVNEENVRAMLIEEDYSRIRKAESTMHKMAMPRAHKLATEYISLGGSSIVDLGMTRPGDRMRYADIYRNRNVGAKAVVAVYFMVKDVVSARLTKPDTRGRLHDDGLRQMIDTLCSYPPTCREGFDKVITLDASTPDFQILDIERPY